MKFYAYIYRDPTQSMEPFYVGKGCGRRAFSKKNAQVEGRIKIMKSLGSKPDIEIIYAIDEEHAFFLEKCLISVFGRRDLGTGTLWNFTDGGEGAAGMSPEAVERMAAKKRGVKSNAIWSDESKKLMSEHKKALYASGGGNFGKNANVSGLTTKESIEKAKASRAKRILDGGYGPRAVPFVLGNTTYSAQRDACEDLQQGRWVITRIIKGELFYDDYTLSTK